MGLNSQLDVFGVNSSSYAQFEEDRALSSVAPLPIFQDPLSETALNIHQIAPSFFNTSIPPLVAQAPSENIPTSYEFYRKPQISLSDFLSIIKDFIISSFHEVNRYNTLIDADLSLKEITRINDSFNFSGIGKPFEDLNPPFYNFNSGPKAHALRDHILKKFAKIKALLIDYHWTLADCFKRNLSQISYEQFLFNDASCFLFNVLFNSFIPLDKRLNRTDDLYSCDAQRFEGFIRRHLTRIIDELGYAELLKILKVGIFEAGLVVNVSNIQNFGIKLDTSEGQRALRELMLVDIIRHGKSCERVHKYGINPDSAEVFEGLKEISLKMHPAVFSDWSKNFGFDLNPEMPSVPVVASFNPVPAIQTPKGLTLNLTDQDIQALLEIKPSEQVQVRNAFRGLFGHMFLLPQKDKLIEHFNQMGGQWGWNLDLDFKQLHQKFVELPLPYPIKLKALLLGTSFFNAYSRSHLHMSLSGCSASFIEGKENPDYSTFYDSLAHLTNRLSKRSQNRQLLLTPRVTDQTLGAFMKYKELELNLFMRKRDGSKPPDSLIPCYVIQSDGNKVHLFVLSARFSNTLGAFTSEGTEAAWQTLKEITKADLTLFGDSEVTLTIEQFRALAEHAKQAPGKFVILKQQRDSSQPISEADVDTSVREKKRDRSKKELKSKEEKMLVKRKRVDEDLPIITIHAASKENGQNKEIKDQESGHVSYKPFGLSSYHDDADARQIDNQNAQRGPDGELIAVPRATSSTELNALNAPTTLAELLAHMTQSSLDEIGEKVEKAASEYQAIQGATPLEYPIATRLAALRPNPMTAPPLLNRLLKSYQIKDTEDLVHASNHGISKILSCEMGLGKTFIFGTYLLMHYFQGVAAKAGPGCRNYIVVPKSLKLTIHRDLIRIFQEGILTAWERYIEGKEVAVCSDHIVRRMSQPYDTHAEEHHLALMLLSKVDLVKLKSSSSSIFSCIENLDFKTMNEMRDIATKKTSELLKRYEKIPAKKEALHAFLNRRGCVIKEQRVELPPIPANFTIPNRKLEFLHTLGTILAFHPDRLPIDNLAYYEEEGVERLVNLPLEAIGCTGDRKHEKLESLIGTARFVVCSYEEMKSTLDNHPEKIPEDSTLVCDEANELANPESQVVISFRKALDKFKRRLLVTGTPYENNLTEFQTLLKLANEDAFPSQTFAALNLVLTQLQKDLQNDSLTGAKASQISIKDLTLTAFGHFYRLKSLAKNLLIVRSKQDQPVIDAWNGLIPEKKEYYIPVDLPQQVKIEHAKALSSFKSGGNQQFKYQSRVRQILTHPELDDLNMKEGCKNQGFLDRLKHDDLTWEELNKFIDESPTLSFIVRSPGFTELLEKGEPGIIFCENRVTGKIIKHIVRKVIMHNQSITPKVTRSFDGQVSASKRQEKIDWLRDNKEKGSKILVVTIQSGGTGFSLPEVNKMWMAAMLFNPALEAQGTARIVRVGSEGLREIYYPDYRDDTGTIYAVKHVNAIKDKKRAWNAFLFNEHVERESFKQWLEVLEKEFYHLILNDLKDVPRTEEKMKKISEALRVIESTTSDEEIHAILNLLAKEPEQAMEVETSSKAEILPQDAMILDVPPQLKPPTGQKRPSELAVPKQDAVKKARTEEVANSNPKTSLSSLSAANLNAHQPAIRQVFIPISGMSQEAMIGAAAHIERNKIDYHSMLISLANVPREQREHQPHVQTILQKYSAPLANEVVVKFYDEKDGSLVPRAGNPQTSAPGQTVIRLMHSKGTWGILTMLV